jgi:hypothetical protein
MWMWLFVKISIYRTFIKYLLKQITFWDENFQITHMVSKTCAKLCEMTWFNIPSTFIKTRNHLIFLRVYLCFWINMYITFVFTNILQSPTLWNEMKFLFLNIFLGYILTKYAKLLWNFFKSLRWHRLKHAHP